MNIVLLERIKDGSSQLVDVYTSHDDAVKDGVTCMFNLLAIISRTSDVMVTTDGSGNTLIIAPNMPVGYSVSTIPVKQQSSFRLREVLPSK